MSQETVEYQNTYRPLHEEEPVGVLSDAEKLLIAIESGQDPSSDIVELLDYSAKSSRADRITADEVGGLALVEGVVEGEEVPLKLGEQPLDELAAAFEVIAKERGEESLFVVIDRIEKAEQNRGIADRVEGTGIPEFDRLDDYSPEFPEQVLMHRSNAEFIEGDIIMPSNQISPEMHKELNSVRRFNSTSSPHAAGTGEHEFYDAKLAHAGTRDFGEVYGKYLYVVEPIEEDTLKWGENFGASVQRKQKAQSTALQVSGELAFTDSYQGKQYNEVVSTKGFRVVEKIHHEPIYGDLMLPWPVGPDAIAKNTVRRENKYSDVAPRGSDTTPGYGGAYKVNAESRKRPGKIGPVGYPGTYRAGSSNKNPAEHRTRNDVIKQHAENPGQLSLPEMPVNKYGRPDRWSPIEAQKPRSPGVSEQDTVLPGMEDHAPLRPLI